MDAKLLRFIRGIYGTERLPFIYFKDRFALQLLSYRMKEDMTVSAVKKSELGYLLEKPTLKKITSSLPGNRLHKSIYEEYIPDDYLAFTLSIGKWGSKIIKHRKDSWNQTTRPGYSMVLQLNFSTEHDLAYYRLLKPKHRDNHPFRATYHPVAQNNLLTMAWARLDFDLDTGEVLIEEIQSDWIRSVTQAKRLMSKEPKRAKKHWLFYHINGSLDNFVEYAETVIKPYAKIWEEAVMSASLKFCKEELGIDTIYYHTYESGNKLKQCEPPRSLYTTLPKRFGFELSKEAPQFIKDCFYLKKTLAKGDLAWWKLGL